jgi:hypothetical protein
MYMQYGKKNKKIKSLLYTHIYSYVIYKKFTRGIQPYFPLKGQMIYSEN